MIGDDQLMQEGLQVKKNRKKEDKVRKAKSSTLRAMFEKTSKETTSNVSALSGNNAYFSRSITFSKDIITSKKIHEKIESTLKVKLAKGF